MDPVENAAMAMFDRVHMADDADHKTWEMAEGWLKDEYLADARAVIASLRKPTPEMIEAMEQKIGDGLYTDGYESTGFYAAYDGGEDPAAPFAAAIDAALEP